MKKDLTAEERAAEWQSFWDWVVDEIRELSEEYDEVAQAA